MGEVIVKKDRSKLSGEDGGAEPMDSNGGIEKSCYSVTSHSQKKSKEGSRGQRDVYFMCDKLSSKKLISDSGCKVPRHLGTPRKRQVLPADSVAQCHF